MNEGGNRIGRQLNVSVRGATPGAAVPSAPWREPIGHGAAASGQASWALTADAIAAGLQRRAADLTVAARAASGRHYQAESADGSITVTVDGRPRLTSVRIADDAARSAPEGFDRALIDTVNDALEDARHGTQALLGRADPALEAWINDAGGPPGEPGTSLAAAARAEAARRVATATSADGSITATVSGLPTVLSIELPRNASRCDGRARLGDAVAEAVNGALATAEQTAREQFGAKVAVPAPDPLTAGKAALDALSSRMDLLLSELDRIGSDLDG